MVESDPLAAFLAQHTPARERRVNWGDLPLRARAYLTADRPPLTYVSSARAVVMGEGSVLVIHNGDERHVLPGGRCEEGESAEETLRREILEETGYEIQEPRLLGFLHFRHLGAMPEGYAYSYPDFLQLVYVARVGRFLPDRAVHDPYVTGSEMVQVEDLDALPIPEEERVFLATALTESA
jgi:ADP-ribose pyrophosphatase YjhB (NUDIX family)